MTSIYKGNSPFKITSPYGNRTINGRTEFHSGIDFVGIKTKEIVAVCDGTIEFSGIVYSKANLTWQWGNYVKLVDKFGNSFFYCHLSSRAVKSGQRVKVGDTIGVEGNTGYSFGSHCHFEMRVSGKSICSDKYLDCVNKIGQYYPQTDEVVPVNVPKVNVADKVKPVGNPDINVGDTVKMIGKTWSTGQSVPAFVKTIVYTVLEVDKSKQKARIGLDNVTTGWARLLDLDTV